MKRLVFLMVIIALAAALVSPGTVKAQYAATQTWTSTIYYYNPNSAGGNLEVVYFDGTGAEVGSTATNNASTIAVDGHGSGEIYIGEVGVPSGFKGSAVLSSSVPLVAVYEQSPSTGPNFSRLLYSAFDISQAGNTIYVPSISRGNGGYMTQLGVQNTSNAEIQLSIQFYKADGTKASPNPLTKSVTSQTSYIFQASDMPGLPTTFKDGSAVITVVSPQDGTAVAAAEELQTNGRRAFAFEGVTATGTQIFMPSFSCKAGHGSQISTYIIQNTSSSATANVTIQAYNDNGAKINSTAYKVAPILKNGKATVTGCNVTNLAPAKTGSAVITSDQPIAVVGKVGGSDGLQTAFTGRTSGSNDIVLPYVAYAANPVKGYRSLISIVNSGPQTTATVNFYRNDGTPFTFEVSLPANGKVTLDPGNLTKWNTKVLRSDGSFRGAVEIKSGASSLISVVRMERKVSGVSGYLYFGEDYTGIPFIPAQ